jgi:hypothetical protein
LQENPKSKTPFLVTFLKNPKIEDLTPFDAEARRY